MNYAFARNQYKKANNAALSAVNDPHEMIGLTMRELSRSLNALQHEKIDSARRQNLLSKAFTAVYILQTSLDFDKGQEIAANLFKVYEYFRTQLQNDLRAPGQAELAVCHEIIEEIIDAWNNIN